MLTRHQIKLQKYEAQFYEKGQGFPLVFLHSFMGNGKYWAPVMAQLSSSYRCIALDLLGFGGSSKPNLNYNIWHQVEFVDQVTQVLALSEFAMVGHSYGGWTAAAYAIGHQENRLKHLSLLAPAGIRDDEFVGRYKHLRPLLWPSPIVDWILNAIAPALTLIGQRETLKFAKRARQNFKEQPVAVSFLRDRLRPEDAIDTVDEYLDQIQVPTLVFAGGLDDVIPLWHCQTYATKIKHVDLIAYESANHDLTQTHSQQISQRIDYALCAVL